MCLSLQEKMQMAAHNPSTSIGADGLYGAGKSIYIKCYLWSLSGHDMAWQQLPWGLFYLKAAGR